jgi:L-asparaginase
VGDSAVIGAGLYVDARHGACACTHTGEMTIRAGTARSVVLALARGDPVDQACLEAVRDLGELASGYLGPVAIHAVDRRGEPWVVATEDLGERITWGFWTEGEREVRFRRPLVPWRREDRP